MHNEDIDAVSTYDSQNDQAQRGEDGLGRREAKLANLKRIYYCETCNMQCTGKVSYDSHLVGKSHNKKLKMANKEGSQHGGQNAQAAAYHCRTCNVDCSGADIYNMHLSGKKHKRAIQNLLETDRPIPSEHLLVPRVVQVNAADRNNKSNNKPAQGSEKNSDQRKRSSPHAVENANIVPLGGAVPLMLTPGGGSTSATLPVNADDRLVLEKLEQIQLDVDQRWFVNQMAKLVESALLKVSMEIESERKGFTAHAAADDAVPPLLCKPQRVGHLANNLLLRSDRRADMVVCCSEIPTRALLHKVTDMFQRVVRKAEARAGCREPLHFAFELPIRSAFTVSRTDLPMTIVVTLTCAKLRRWSCKERKFYSEPRPHDALPKQFCLIALYEIERTEYYKAKCEPLQSMTTTVKIVRDFANRVPAWNCVDYWMIQVLVKEVLSRQRTQLGPGAALKAIFETITEHRILEPPLLDPCDREIIDVLDPLFPANRNQKGAIVACARDALRQINTNNMAKLLALDDFGSGGIPSSVEPPGPKKSRRSNSSNRREEGRSS